MGFCGRGERRHRGGIVRELERARVHHRAHRAHHSGAHGHGGHHGWHRLHCAAMGRCCHRRGSRIGDEVGGAPPAGRLTIARVQRLAPREVGAFGPRHAHIGAGPFIAVDALHHVKGRAALNRSALVGTNRHLSLQGRCCIEVTVPKLHGLTIGLRFAGEARNWIRQVDAASRAHEAQEQKAAANAPSHRSV